MIKYLFLIVYAFVHHFIVFKLVPLPVAGECGRSTSELTIDASDGVSMACKQEEDPERSQLVDIDIPESAPDEEMQGPQNVL